MKKVSFYSYMIKQYLKEWGPKGDLARDMKYDCKHFPKNHKKGYEIVRGYLEANGACDACMDVFEKSWEEYINYVNSN